MARDTSVAGPVQSGRVTRSNRKPRIQVAPEKLAAAAGIPTLEPVYGQPPAWSENRPELCDALPWFRSTQGGAYHLNNLCFGFLVDADCGDRSYIDDEIVITRIGGNCVKDAEGNLILTKDLDADKATVKSILNSLSMKIPVGLIIGNRNTLLKRKLPHRYNVMDWFRITNVWHEKIGNKTGFKVRFEKLHLSEKSWWAANDSTPVVPLEQRDFHTKPASIQCQKCLRESLRLYKEGWMCLEPSCDAFWKIDGTPASVVLSFHPDFLSFRARPDASIKPHHSLVPDLLSTINNKDADVSTIRITWKGIVCPQCSRCISRVFWDGWKCTDDLAKKSSPFNNNCAFEKILNMPPVSLRSVLDDLELGPIKRALFFEEKFARPEIDDQSLFPYRKLTYKISGIGSITHLVSNRAINSRKHGPNELFKNLQEDNLALRRYPLQQSVVAGTLTAHFAVNYGMPYKYVVSVDSKGFDEASDEVLRALGRLTWATEMAVTSAGDEFLSPNELLMLGYLEGMKIGYHDDGEASLGPTIATLSLGAKSTMLIRMKYKYYNGLSRVKKPLEEDPVLEHCKFEANRRMLKDQFEAGQISKQKYDSDRRKLLGETKGGEAHPIIKIELNHGDLVVMHGEKLQKFYEHSVVPEDKLRFALTARYIRPGHIDDHDRKKGNFTLTPDQIYDGQ